MAHNETSKRMTDAVCAMLLKWHWIPIREYRLPNGQRLDVAVKLSRERLLGFELKQSVSDFNRDNGWPDRFSRCWLFYFVVPEGFNVNLIHPGIRVITVSGDCARITRKTGAGFLRPSQWSHATGTYAVKPTVSAAALR